MNPLFIAGPTAAGKSAIALALAQKIGGEIISVDSMQVYRGLDLGTAKPSAADLARVPHHLINVVDLSESFDAAWFVRGAEAAVKQIQSRGRVPIFCGGTGLYFKVWLDGLGQAPAGDPKLRAELEATPLDQLLVELEKADPVTFGQIDRKNPRRVIRALEVIRLTGQPFSAQRAAWPDQSSKQSSTLAFGFARAAGDLHERIQHRVDEMFRNGLVAETERLMACGLAENRTAMQALGYRQVAEHLRGERSLPETIELVKIRTRQFAKRQLTWFRRQLRLEWITLDPAAAPAAIAADLARRWEQGKR